MSSRPAFTELLDEHGLLGSINEALAKDDTPEIVMITMGALKAFDCMPRLVKTVKTELLSTEFRQKGNEAFQARKYQSGLELYNRALLYAPCKSLEMILAYNNRSALLLKIKAYSNSIRDIDICLSMECPKLMEEKLQKRKEIALKNMWAKSEDKVTLYSTFCDKFFKLNTSRNPYIPCASMAVGVILDDQLPKIIATSDIKVGTVVTVETAFVSQGSKEYRDYSCHHCQKLSLNLIPCNKCCFALFCDEDCMKISYAEYHDIECQFIEIIPLVSYGFMTLTLRALLKMRKMCKSWKEFILSSQSLGIDRLKTHSFDDIFDVNKKFALLSFRDDIHFVHGALYNASFACAIILHYLENIESFFPQSLEERKEAIKAVARISMFLSTYSTATRIASAVSVVASGKTLFQNITKNGWFGFTGKLKHACNRNLYVAGLDNAVALIAIQPIKRGTELTISYLSNFLEDISNTTKVNRHIFMVYRIVCDCYICGGKCETKNEYPLNDVQKKSLRKLNLSHTIQNFHPQMVPQLYKKLCKSLAVFHDVLSKEYMNILNLFKICILVLQSERCNNEIVEYIRNDNLAVKSGTELK